MLDDMTEQYFNEKNVDKRRTILKNLVFKCESCSKGFFEKAFKKERNLVMKLLALRGYAFFSTENEVEKFVEIIMRSLIKVPETTPYAYNLYEDMKGKYLLPYLVETYQYPCFIQLAEQVEKQYDVMPEVFKHIYSYNEFGNFIQFVNLKKRKDQWRSLSEQSGVISKFQFIYDRSNLNFTG